MQTIELTPEEFSAKLNTVVRFWNQDTQEGEADNQASEDLKQSCAYIFVRDDGWSIASPYYEPAYKLWPGDWAYCYELEDQGPVEPGDPEDGHHQYLKDSGQLKSFDDDSPPAR